MRDQSAVARHASQVAIASGIVLLGSFASTLVVAGAFGASRETDGYVVAQTISLLLVSVIAVPLGAVTIPMVIRAESADVARGTSATVARGTSATVFWLALALLTLTVVALQPWRDQLVATMAPGFSQGERGRTSALLAVMMPAAIPLGASTVLAAILNARDRFFVAAASPVLSSAFVIVAVLLFQDAGLIAVAAGWLAGNLTAFCAVFVSSRAWVMRRPTTAAATYVQLGAATPYVLTALVTQATTFTVRWVGSSLAPGTVTAVQLATTLGHIPLMILGFSLGSALVPSFARTMLHDARVLRASYEHAQRLLGAVLAPAGIMLALYAKPVVDVFLKRGAFDDRASTLTAESLSIIALGLVFYGPVIVGHRALLAASASGTIAVLEAVSAGVLIMVAFGLGPVIQHRGLALAYALVVPMAAVLYSRVTMRQFDVGLNSATVGVMTRRAAYAAAAATVSLSGYAVTRTFDGGQALCLTAALALAISCYLALHRAERDSELLAALISLPRLVSKRVGR